MLYVNQNYVEAIKIFQNIITLEPNVHVAWTTLATCYEELNYEEKALQCEMVAAHLRPSAETWKELGARSRCVVCSEADEFFFLSFFSFFLGMAYTLDGRLKCFLSLFNIYACPLGLPARCSKPSTATKVPSRPTQRTSTPFGIEHTCFVRLAVTARQVDIHVCPSNRAFHLLTGEGRACFGTSFATGHRRVPIHPETLPQRSQRPPRDVTFIRGIGGDTPRPEPYPRCIESLSVSLPKPYKCLP